MGGATVLVAAFGATAETLLRGAAAAVVDGPSLLEEATGADEDDLEELETSGMLSGLAFVAATLAVNGPAVDERPCETSALSADLALATIPLLMDDFTCKSRKEKIG